MRILHSNGSFFPTFDSFLVPSCWKDYFLETEVLCKCKGSEKSQSSGSCGFTNLLYKSLKCYEAYFFDRIKQLAEEAIGNIYLGGNKKKDRFSYHYKISVASVSLCR